VEDNRHRRCQVEQSAHGVVGSAAGAHLEPVTEEEGGEEGGRLVEDIPPMKNVAATE